MISKTFLNILTEYVLPPILAVSVSIVGILILFEKTNLFDGVVLEEGRVPVEEDATDFTEEDLEGPHDSLFEEYLAFKEGKKLQVLTNSIYTPSIVTKDFIISKSVKIETSGSFKEVYLYIEGRAGQPFRSLNEYESIYFYIDSGLNGGHLYMPDSLPVDGGKFTTLLFKNKISIIQLPYDEVKEPQEIDLKEILIN